MVALGVVLIILGLVFPTVHILCTIGVVLLVIGAVLWVLGLRWPPGGRQAVLVLTHQLRNRRSRACSAGTRPSCTEHT